MTQHALPWRVDWDRRPDGADQIVDANGLTVAFIATPKGRHEEQAEYAVKACNNYPATLEALRDVANFKVRYRGDASTNELLDTLGAQFDALQAKVRAVLATIDTPTLGGPDR